MKLLTSEACLSAADGGNVKRSTVMGEVLVDWLLDRGSTPLISILLIHVQGSTGQKTWKGLIPSGGLV